MRATSARRRSFSRCSWARTGSGGRLRHEDMVAGREEANMQQSEQVRVRAPPAGRVVVIAWTATWPSTLQGGTVNHHHQSDSGGG